jgi:hypothetical protein
MACPLGRCHPGGLDNALPPRSCHPDNHAARREALQADPRVKRVQDRTWELILVRDRRSSAVLSSVLPGRTAPSVPQGWVNREGRVNRLGDRLAGILIEWPGRLRCPRRRAHLTSFHPCWATSARPLLRWVVRPVPSRTWVAELSRARMAARRSVAPHLDPIQGLAVRGFERLDPPAQRRVVGHDLQDPVLARHPGPAGRVNLPEWD